MTTLLTTALSRGLGKSRSMTMAMTKLTLKNCLTGPLPSPSRTSVSMLSSTLTAQSSSRQPSAWKTLQFGTIRRIPKMMNCQHRSPLLSPVHCQSTSANPSDGSTEAGRDKILTVPNALCFARIAASPCLVHLISTGQHEWAFGLFLAAGLSDLADGYIARKFPSQASMFGSFLDPLADKILVTSLFLSLTYVNIIPAPLASLVISRDFLLIIAGFYIRYLAVKPPFSFKKYFDLKAPIAQVQPTTISKANTAVQLTLVGAALVAPMVQMQNHPAFYGLCGITACTTFASAVSYAFMRDTYKFSHRSYDHQAGKKLSAFAFFIVFNLAFVYCFPVKKDGPTRDTSGCSSSSNNNNNNSNNNATMN